MSGIETNNIDYSCLYDKNVYVEIINSLLTEYGEKRIFENKSFFAGELSSDGYLHLLFERPERVRFELRVSDYDVQIQIDRAPEVFNITTDEKYGDVFRNFITDLFTSTIKVEYLGTYHTHIYFLDKSNKEIRHISYNEGILGLLPIKTGKKEIIEYPPILLDTE